MTILLVFLLVTITSDPLSITQDEFLTLAKSTASADPEDSIPITVTKESIIVDNKKIVKVDCTNQGGAVCTADDYEKGDKNTYAVDKSFKEDGNPDSFLIEPLTKKLEELVKIQKEDEKNLGDDYKFKGVVTIVCDLDIPFRIIAEVVHSAGMAELAKLRFAILKTNTR
jgi:hypothetical protein